MTATVGVLGAGTIGRGVGRFFLNAGHRVLISNSRGPETLVDVAADLGANARAVTTAEAAAADIVLLAVPWTAVEPVLGGLGSWGGRILIDATNAIKRFDPPAIELFDFGDRTSSQVIAALAPGARVVKAFNHLAYQQMIAPVPAGEKRAYFYCGDDSAAKNELAGILRANDFAAIDLGGLADGSRVQQVGGPLATLDLRLAP
jgi:8-hydroxy-5-deazaflavin:NADPH oxidoreductase